MDARKTVVKIISNERRIHGKRRQKNAAGKNLAREFWQISSEEEKTRHEKRSQIIM